MKQRSIGDIDIDIFETKRKLEDLYKERIKLKNTTGSKFSNITCSRRRNSGWYGKG